jgi:type I restriction enzyme M protein
MKKDKYISTSDIARILGVSRQAIQKRLKGDSNVKIKKVGSSFLYEIDSLPTDILEKIKKIQKEVSERVINMTQKKLSKDIDFEKELWEAADKLRGNIDPGEYKNVVLGLIFLKYISDAFYKRKNEIEKEVSDPGGASFIRDESSRKYYVEQKEPYRAKGIFYVPEIARWDYLKKHTMHSNIGKYLDEALEAIENENTTLKGILPKVYSRLPLESHTISELINIFSRINFDYDIDKERDILGRVYEYFLGQFASAEGKRGGEFYTPSCVVKLLVEVLEPYEGARVFDPACGSGGMFVQSGEFLRIHQKDPSKISFYGQESNINTWRLCKMNLALRGIDGQIEQGNSYYDNKFSDKRFDFVISNPPFNAEWEPSRLDPKDPRLKYGIPPSGNANFMWIQHFIYHLAPNGVAGFVMANGALAVSGKEGEIRKKIIEDDLVDIIIACPPKLFYNVSLPVSLWFLTKSKKNGRFRNRVGETLFIDAREIYRTISRKQVEFTQDQIIFISSIVKLWRGENVVIETLNTLDNFKQRYEDEIKELKEFLDNESVTKNEKKKVDEKINELKDLLRINLEIKDLWQKNFSNGYKDISGLNRSVKIDKIRENDYVLTPGRYVGIKENEEDNTPFEEKINKLTLELEEYFREGRKLEEKIMENLKKINYESKE